MTKLNKIFCILLLFACVGLYADGEEGGFVQEDEIHSIENMIIATEKQLEMQKEIKALMEEFKNCRFLFMQEDHSKKHAARMIDVANTLLGKIQEHHLEYAFSSAYLKELAVFASIASKKTLKNS